MQRYSVRIFPDPEIRGWPALSARAGKARVWLPLSKADLLNLRHSIDSLLWLDEIREKKVKG